MVTQGKPVRQLLLAVGVFVVVVAGVAALLIYGNDDVAGNPTAQRVSVTPTPTPTPKPKPKPPPRDRVIAVKIDNVALARPQTGIAAAEAVYVEPVEGGLTRLAAVYSSNLPGVVGPVRSARGSDIPMLSQFGHPTLAFSGAAPAVVRQVGRSPLNPITPKARPGAFFRNGSRPGPHNLYVRPKMLPPGAGIAPRHAFQYGPAPRGGRRMTDRVINYRAASYAFHWSAGEKRWLISLDGRPVRSAGAGRVGAPTVVVQHVVNAANGRGVRDSTGSLSPVVLTVGRGEATVMRDGKAFFGSWSRPNRQAPTRFHFGNGRPLKFAPGPVWILLVPH